MNVLEFSISQMNKLTSKPVHVTAIISGLAVFNVAVLAQGQVPGAPEIEALKFILLIVGGVTFLVITAFNIWAAIKNKNYAEIKEADAIKERLISSLRLEIAEVEKERAEEKATRIEAEREVRRKNRLLEESEEENLRLKGMLRLKGESHD